MAVIVRDAPIRATRQRRSGHRVRDLIGFHTIARTTPPSTRSAAPVVAEAAALQTYTIIAGLSPSVHDHRRPLSREELGGRVADARGRPGDQHALAP